MTAEGQGMDVSLYTARVEQAINTVFIAERLAGAVVRTVRGPHTIAFALSLHNPVTARLRAALRLGPPIEHIIKDGPVRIYQDRGLIYVEAPSPWNSSVPAVALSGVGLSVPLGRTSMNEVTGIDFRDTPHLLCIGPTRRGKTTAMRAMAFHLARQNPAGRVGLIAFTSKAGDWQSFAPVANMWAVVSEPAETAAALEWLAAKMRQRAYSGNKLPVLFAFVDDLLNLLAVADVPGSAGHAMGNNLAAIASQGAGLGIHLVIGTQRLGEVGAGGRGVTGNITNRLVFGTADAQDAALFAGRPDTGAHLLGRYPGDALLITDAGAQRIAVSAVRDRDMGLLPVSGVELRPWLLTPSPVTGAPLASVTDLSLAAANQDDSAKPQNTTPPPVTVPTVTNRLPWRTPTAAERARLRALYAKLGSKSEVLRVAYGGKNGQSWAWLNQALEEAA